jgi:CBS domain-containing protein
MKVQNLMTKNVRSCAAEANLSEPARIMWEEDCGCVPVVESEGAERVIGMITDRDISMAAYTTGRALPEIGVREAMSRGVSFCRPGDSLHSAEATMRVAQIRRLPVVDDSEQLLGILSLSDIASGFLSGRGAKKRAVTGTELSETLAAICEPRRVPTQTPVE